MIIEHMLSVLKGKWTMIRLRNVNAIFKMRSNRGKQIFDGIRDLALWGNIYVVLSLKFPWFKIWYLLPLIPTYVIGMYVVGYYDEKVFKFWQEERNAQAKHANPYFEQLRKDIDILLERSK